MISVLNLWIRDGGVCHLCPEPVGLSEASRDHVIPRSKGGSNTLPGT
jgi:5-methylcytosine-specific restriction endonuclease McrA